MVNSLIADNVVTGHLLRRESGPNALHVENSTIAGNSIGAAHVISASGDVVLVRSISWQPGRTTLAQSSGSRNVNNVLANEVISLGGGGAVSTIVNDDPLFVDAASGDYRPHAASTAVDFASSGGGPDLAGNMRAFDLPIKPNWNGTGDLGAYERVDMAPLVRNADFDGDLRLWDVQGSTTWVNENFVGRAGALRISKSGLVGGERVVGASHCVPLPGPGTYRLSGAGRAPGTIIVGGGELPGDSLRIAWQLKPATGLNCGGTASAIGEINLGTQPTWHHAAAPAEITLLPSQWTRGARLLVQLVVENTDAFNAPIANGYFDGITLELAGNDTIFRNGFDD
uniref:hypothetical protein n=1 Tax=Dokdonella sp. TaxID=2291710 RepID=UPI002628078E